MPDKNNVMLVVRRLAKEDALAFIELRREALYLHPLVFTVSPEDSDALSFEKAQDLLSEIEESTVFGVFDRAILSGMVGVFRDRYQKARHRVFFRELFVSSRLRGQGAGALLIRAALDYSKHLEGVTQVHLSVTNMAEDAARLYERFGFCLWGIEPKALQWQGCFADERHMVLCL